VGNGRDHEKQRCKDSPRNAEKSRLQQIFAVLTPREHDVLGLMAKGLSNREIATELFISEHTVKNHIYNIYRKTGINDRTQIVVAAIKAGVVKASQVNVCPGS